MKAKNRGGLYSRKPIATNMDITAAATGIWLAACNNGLCASLLRPSEVCRSDRWAARPGRENAAQDRDVNTSVQPFGENVPADSTDRCNTFIEFIRRRAEA